MRDVQEVLRSKCTQYLELQRQVHALEAASHALRAVDYLLVEDEPAEACDAAANVSAMPLSEDRPSDVEQLTPSPRPEALDGLDEEQKAV